MTWWSWPCHQIDWLWPYFDWCTISCFLDLLNVYHPSFFSSFGCFCWFMAMFCIHHLFMVCSVDWLFPWTFTNIPILRKEKKWPKKEKNVCRIWMDLLQKILWFVTKSHQKSPVSWEYCLLIIKIIRNLQKKRIIFIYYEIQKE